MSNKLIEAYVASVGENLPEKSRADIEAEISSLLQDMVDARAEAEGRAPDEEMVCAVLREYGEPEKVAASYREPRYLIGPRLFPAFLTVLKIVLAVLGALALAGLVYTLTRLGTVPLESILREGIESLAKYLSAAVTVFGNVVLIFAILELVLPRVGRISPKPGIRARCWAIPPRMPSSPPGWLRISPSAPSPSCCSTSTRTGSVSTI